MRCPNAGTAPVLESAMGHRPAARLSEPTVVEQAQAHGRLVRVFLAEALEDNFIWFARI